MSLKENILKQLKEANGGFVSGQMLAEQFSVSRAAVWKATATLKKEGYLIESTQKIGYRLIPSDVLDEGEISSFLNEAGEEVKTYVFSTLPSTNEYAERLLNEGKKTKQPFLVVANEQTQGRARQGKVFPSKTGGVYMTLAFYPDLSSAHAKSLIFDIYEIVRRLLNGTSGGAGKENEIYLGGKKACGILAECTADPDYIKSCLVGIGIYPEFFSALQDRYPTRNQLIAKIVQEILRIK